MKITVDVKGLHAVKAHLSGMGRQVAFAASKALNATGKVVSQAMPAEIGKAIDRPTPFTSKGVALLKAARKDRLEAVVGFKTAQAKYMRWQIEGGTYQPGRAGLRLPAAINLNEFGNIPRGAIARLIAVARKERKLTRVQSRRIAVSSKADLFYGDPTDNAGKGLPRGIYKDTGKALIPLIVFPVTPARYRPRFDFYRVAERVVLREWPGLFERELAEALRTAR